MMKTNRRLASALPLCAVMLLFSGWLISCGGKDELASDAVMESSDSSDKITSIMAFGTLVTTEQQEIHLPFACRIEEIPVWEGKRVSKGDVLAVLDSGDLSTAIGSARMESESALGLYEESADRLAALDVALSEAADRLERNRKVQESGSISVQNLASLQAEYDGLLYDRSAANWVLMARKNDAEQAGNTYQRLLERSTDTHIEDNVLVSPFDSAIVAEIGIRPGAEVAAGDLAMILHNESSLMVEADLSEEFVRDVSAGSPVRIIPIADPERSYTGTVVELAGIARLVNGENTVKTRIRLDERDGFLREGFNVDVEINPED